jgi:ATP-dependent Clp protease ATP-binding subunit ClpB
MGFGAGQREVQITEDAVMDILRRKLPGEFLSRVDEMVVFEPLSDDTVLEIARTKLEEIVRQRFARQSIDVSFGPAVVRYIASRGYDARLGCRRLERVIQKEILEPLAERMYRSDWCDVRSIQVTVAGEEIAFSRDAVLSEA